MQICPDADGKTVHHVGDSIGNVKQKKDPKGCTSIDFNSKINHRKKVTMKTDNFIKLRKCT